MLFVCGVPGVSKEPVVGAGPEGNALIRVFSRLGFEEVEADKLSPGAPQKMKITAATLVKMKKLMSESQGISISDGGEVEIIEVK
jgi:hypothetical protein